MPTLATPPLLIFLPTVRRHAHVPRRFACAAFHGNYR